MKLFQKTFTLIAIIIALGCWQYGWAGEAIHTIFDHPAELQHGDVTKGVASLNLPEWLLVLFTFLLWLATCDLVKGAEKSSRKQLRAYLTVVVGGAVFQQRREGVPDLKFEAKPMIVNTGSTPAYNVRFKIAADILPAKLPKGFDFPLSEEIKGGSVIGSHQSADMSATVKDFIGDKEVDDVKYIQSLQRALHVWGIVTYTDIFGDNWETEFAQIVFWHLDGKIYGHYNPDHSKAT